MPSPVLLSPPLLPVGLSPPQCFREKVSYHEGGAWMRRQIDPLYLAPYVYPGPSCASDPLTLARSSSLPDLPDDVCGQRRARRRCPAFPFHSVPPS